MTIPQFKKWLQSEIDNLQDFHDGCRHPEDWDDILDLQEEAYQIAVDLQLPEVAEVLGKPGPVTVRFLEALDAIPVPDVLTMEEGPVPSCDRTDHPVDGSS